MLAAGGEEQGQQHRAYYIVYMLWHTANFHNAFQALQAVHLLVRQEFGELALGMIKL